MRTYYFDFKDGVAVRDRCGIDLVSDGAAIAHSKDLAARVRDQKTKVNPDLHVVVVDENGREVHREKVYPK